MKANRVDIMVGHNRVSDGIQITRTAKELAYNPSFMGGVLGAPNTREYIEALGKDADNVFGTDSFSPLLNAPGLPAVVERVKVKMNRVMDVGVSTIMAIPSYGTRLSAPRPRIRGRFAMRSRTPTSIPATAISYAARCEVQRQRRQQKSRRHHHPNSKRPGRSGLAG